MTEPNQRRDFGDAAGVLRYIQERSDDIDRVVVPKTGIATFRDRATGEVETWEAGLVVFLMDGSYHLVHPQDAPAVLENGILERMRIKVDIE